MDSATSALLVVNMQQGYFRDGARVLYNREALVRNTKSLVDKFRAVWAPVVFVQQDGPKGSALEPESPGWIIHSSIQPANREVVVRKARSSAFADTTLREVLERRQVDTVVVAGVETEGSVDSTIRHASILGYKVVAVKDAHSTFDTDVLSAPQIIDHHNMIWERWFAECHSEEDVSFAWQACNL